MRYLIHIVLPMVALAWVPTIQAQVPPAAGARVRVTSAQLRRGTTIGRLERISADTIVVDGQAISRTSIRLLEVSVSHRTDWASGMAIGLFGGAGGAALFCAAICKPGRDEGNSKTIPILVSGLFGGFVGFIAGGIIGGKHRSDQWRTVPTSTLRIMPSLGPGGTIGLAVGFRF